MAKLWKFSQGHPKPAYSEKLHWGDQGKFFKHRPKSSPRLKDSKALWRKWHYPLISMHLNCKGSRRFWWKQRHQKCSNTKVMVIFATSPKTRIFWKSAKGGLRQIFQKSPKRSPRLKSPKELWHKWHYPPICMYLNCKNCRRFLWKQRLQKCPNGQVIAIFARSPKTRILWKRAKGGRRESFEKSPKK